MDRQALFTELQALIANETHSLARHVDHTAPHLTPDTYEIWNYLKHLGTVSVEHSQRLAGLVQDFDFPPQPASYPTMVAHYHFLDITGLVPELVLEKRQQVQAYQRAIGLAGDQLSIADELRGLLVDNQSHLEQLQAFQRDFCAGPAPASQKA